MVNAVNSSDERGRTEHNRRNRLGRTPSMDIFSSVGSNESHTGVLRDKAEAIPEVFCS